MRMKKCLSILLAVVMIATMITSLPITANAVDVDAAGVGDGTMIEVDSATELEAACKEINDGAGGTYTISLTADIENGHVKVTNPDAVVTVIGNNKKIFNIGTAVYVSGGATVNLGDGVSALTLQGDNQVHKEGVGNDNPGIVYVMENSTCTMKANVTLKDHRGNNYLGGGVTVEGGTFHMYGGTIQNCGIDGGSVCYGGGVAVFAGGSFVMDNGLITRCYIRSTNAYTWDDYNSSEGKINPQYTSTACGGGVFVTGGSSFTMNNGTISYNSVVNDASEKPYGDLAYGGGVGMMLTFNERNDSNTPGFMGNPQSSVVINGGTIIGNRAENGGGIYASGYYYCYNVPIGTKGPEEQVTANPGLFINDGAISENTATDAGGGIYVAMLCPWTRGNGAKGAKTQIHNAEIINNTADNGAGIECYGYWTQMDIDDCTIAENKAATLGGGILLVGNSSSGLTKLKDTTITGNKSGDFGAGVYYDSASKLYISGANIIQNNKLYDENENKYYDNNLNVLSKDYPVYVDGALTGSQIGLSDPSLWDDGKEDAAPDAVSADKLTSGYRAYNPEIHPSEYFTSDHETWIVERTEKTETKVDDPNSKVRRKYNFNRYPLEDGIFPHSYAGYNSQFAIIKIESDLTAISNDSDMRTAIFNELNSYFNNSKYSVSLGKNYPPNWIRYDYKPIGTSNNALDYIGVEKKQNNEITVTYQSKGNMNAESSATNRKYKGVVTYTASVANQRKYANPGELVLQITSGNNSVFNNLELYNFKFSTVSTSSADETIEYVDMDPPGNVLYEYNEYGDITAKLEVGTYTSEQAQITIETGTEDEVRLVRKKPDYHINNEYIDDNYNNNDIFTPYVEAATKEVKVGETIDSFFLIPEVVPTATNTCPYIFKGWYYDQNNENDAHPVQFGTDKYAKDIYAHWIKVEDVAKDADDPYSPASYGGFDLAGVQIRKERTIDTNFDYARMPGGMRFITSLSKKVVDEINALTPGTDNIEYGYVAATDKNAGWINYHDKLQNKLLYVDNDANGIDTSSTAPNNTYFDFANNVDCTSRESNRTNGRVAQDHRSYDGYLLYTLVVTYENENADKDLNVLARPYIHYTDANGLERVAYSDYNGQSKKLGGCYTNYNKLTELEAKA